MNAFEQTCVQIDHYLKQEQNDPKGLDILI